jgi:flagellar biosynthesis protein
LCAHDNSAILCSLISLNNYIDTQCRKRAKMSDDEKNSDKEGFDSMPSLDPLHPKNLKSGAQKKEKRKVAVAIKGKSVPNNDPSQASRKLAPSITASGYGYIAEQIMELAFENDVRVREDADLAELLTHLDQDSPIPVEAVEAIAEILSYVYQANGAPNPFDAVLKHAIEHEDDKSNHPNNKDE